MIIYEDDLKNIVLFILKPYLDKYGFLYVDSQIKIDKNINLKLELKYNQQSLFISTSFLFDYENQSFLIKDIEGKIKYSFIELSILQFMKQFIKIPKLIINDYQCLYPIKLPIEKIIYENQKMIIKTKESFL